MADITAIILTYNEEKHIARVLENLRPVCDEIYVIDSFSSDQTVEIARRSGAKVLQNKFLNYARQFEWAMRNAPISTDWVLRFDADELLTDELAEELTRTLSTLPPDVTGLNMNRRHVFLGKWIRHGGRYPLTLLRAWRKDCAKIEQRWMDEHMHLLRGRAVNLKHDFIDHNLNDLTFFTAKHNQYATREAIDVIGRRHGLFQVSGSLDATETSRQAAVKRWVKLQIYNRLSIGIGPLAYFLYRYFLQLGFLDGREGLIYHLLQGFWYRFLVAAKVVEFERELGASKALGEKVSILAKLTGYPMEAFQK